MTKTELEAVLELAAQSRKGWVEPMTLDEADFSQPSQEPSAIVFQAADNRIILTMHSNGQLERGGHFATDDEASVAMFDCLSRCFPCFLNDLRQRAERAELAMNRMRDAGPSNADH